LFGIEEYVFAPNSLNNLFPTDKPIFVFDEKDQHLHGDLFKPQHNVPTAKLITLEVEIQSV
jgi:hypothetical protein